MHVPLLNQGALSLAVVSLLASTVSAEVFDKLVAVPEGKQKKSPVICFEARFIFMVTLRASRRPFWTCQLPTHPNYGKHFKSHEEVKRMLQPAGESVEAIHQWLEKAGITHIQQDADWMTFYTTVEKANNLLDANFQYYLNENKQVERLRTLEYSVPDELVSHINLVTPTTRFGQLHAEGVTLHDKSKDVDEQFRQAATSPSSDCNSAITPQCLKDLYKVGDYKASASNGNKVAFTSYLEQYARYSDLALFEQNIAPYAQGQNFTVIQYNGGLNDQSSPARTAKRANLDLQYIIGTSSPVPVTEFSTGGRGPLVPDLDQPDINDNNNEPYLDFLQNVIKMSDKDLPQVISTSYGEDEQSVPASYARSVCNLIAQLGGRGVSVIFSSGDSGFPAACPWVTSVGATTGISPERGVFFSSGGFSDLWSRPSWQSHAVKAYLHKLGKRQDGLFNREGRAFPDVSAQGENYAIYAKGRLGKVDGTSCSAPAFAGLVSLLNDARIKAGKSSLGFLNPWLYSHPDALNDITVGGSTGCDGNARFGGRPNGSPVVPYASWNATEGWDPVTGLGTPNFQKLLKSAVKQK
ncbi:Tripeptidyl-peptidase sed2 [Penicillium oxalicum]|uniref:Tripeptidyl-peptidase sed2 n=1 Tax=Penicillium oxalicum TaxID=69781 RepID=UPI0020B706B8|nr:Tripeptidyl-peptidase sed2 [Penicillium oxalicum]KAI2786887.1 Tripeptidyl-peptidase sed2 [Penicillium oxalicum]